MAAKELRDRVDAEWRDQGLGWSQESHDRERNLIYDYLDKDEHIMGLVGCTWGPSSAFNADAGLMLRQQRLKGVAVATNLGVYLLARKGLNKLVTQMPLPSITAVEHTAGIVTLDGAGIHNWAGMAQDDPFQVQDVAGGRGASFADLVQRLQTEPSATFSPPSAGQYLAQSKSQRIDAQWEERSPMPGRTDQGFLAGLLSSLSGDNLKKYDSGRKKLHEILDEDENIEFWLGGRWGAPDEFRSSMSGRSPGRGNDGIAVATDRRVLLLPTGLIGPGEVVLPYEHIDDVGYNDGMISSGVEFRGNTIEPYNFYFDHNNKADVKGAARRLVDCVQQHLATPPTAD